MEIEIKKQSIMKWYILIAIALVVSLVVINCFIRSGFQFSIDYNEGWNAAYAKKVFNNESLYSDSSLYIGNNYPPLSFYIISFLSNSPESLLIIGRTISLISVLLISFIVSFVVKKKDGDYFSSIFSGVFSLGLFSILANHYVGMNDPQLLGNLISTLALMLYLVFDRKHLFFISFLLVFSIFIKHSLVILPFVIFIDLILNDFKKVLKYILFTFINVLLFIGLIFLISEQQFLTDILLLENSRIFSIQRAIKNSFYELSWIQIPIVIGISYLFWFQKQSANRTVLIYIIFSIIIGVYFTGGEGVDINVFFDLFIGLSISIGFVLNFFRINVNKETIPQAINWVLPLMIFFGLLLVSPSKILRPSLLKKYTEKQNDFLKDVEMLKKHNGFLMSENILLNYSGDKEFLFDAFYVSQLLKSGKLKERDFIKDIEFGKYSIIQLKKEINLCYKVDSVYGDLEFPQKQGKFSAKFSKNTLRAIERYYTLFLVSRDGFYYQYKKNY